MGKVFFRYIIFLLVLLSFLYSPNTVRAQQFGEGLSISPPTIELESDPGETKSFIVTIRNETSQPYPISVSITDFVPSDELGNVDLIEKSEYSVAKWSSVSPTTFVLDANESKEVEVTVNVPENIAGGIYGSVVFNGQREPSENSASIAQEIASLFLISTTGEVQENLFISDILVPRFSQFGPVPMRVRFENKGNIHIKTQGLVTITNIFGNKVEDAPIDQENVFPGSSRIVNVNFDKRWLFGPYQAQALVYYGKDNKSLAQETIFYVFPLRLIVILILVLLVLYLLRRRIGRKVGYPSSSQTEIHGKPK